MTFRMGIENDGAGYRWYVWDENDRLIKTGWEKDLTTAQSIINNFRPTN